MLKVAVCVLIALLARFGNATPNLPPDCKIIKIAEDIYEINCTSIKILTQGDDSKVISMDKELFRNDEVIVLELNNDRSSCYVVETKDLPSENEGAATEVIVVADETHVQWVLDLAPTCRGRKIKQFVQQRDSEEGGRKKRSADCEDGVRIKCFPDGSCFATPC